MSDINETPPGPVFDDAFREQLLDLFRWRRDVRHFNSEPLAASDLDDLLNIMSLAPSVGNSQPWRFVKVGDAGRRAKIRANFEACNADALGDYAGERAKLYATLKLEGMEQAPSQIAVFVDEDTEAGRNLGQKTMPETLRYSVVSAINILWLAARAKGIGIGWVSILDPVEVGKILDVPEDWDLVAYLCIGYPEEEHIEPELQRIGWQDRLDISNFVIER